jgi:hypothetical protein
VARERFVDNVYHQAVDHCLLTGPMSPLSVLTQDWVAALDRDQLEALVGESDSLKDRRSELMRQKNKLEEAMKILRI